MDFENNDLDYWLGQAKRSNLSTSECIMIFIKVYSIVNYDSISLNRKKLSVKKDK